MKRFEDIDLAEFALYFGGVFLGVILLSIMVLAFGLVFVSPISLAFKILSLPIIFMLMGWGVIMFWDNLKNMVNELKD